jgi:O-antigen biosynthesis protein
MIALAIKKQISTTQNLLRPLHPFVNALERILMLLPRHHQNIKILAHTELNVLDIQKGEYEATGNDPQFKLEFEGVEQIHGWFYLEAALVRHSGNRIAKIYFDNGRGYNEADSIFIPSNLRGSIREVFYLPKGIKNLRWDPIETAGHFFQSPLIIHRITSIESFYRRAWRTAESLWQYRHLSINERKGISWKDIFINLEKAYKWSANLRVDKTVGVDYTSFIKRNDSISFDEIQAIESHINDLKLKPLLSIVMPVYNPPIAFFCEALDSIIAQHYSNWELCIADDASTNLKIKPLIEEYIKKDSRIKVVYRSKNGHISAASNTALDIVQGDFVVLMDQDDLLPSHALYHVAVEINRHPETCLIYSDEDKIDEFGKRFDPYFKSDWNLDLFYAQNMFSHLGVYKTSLVLDVGGFRLGYEGSQDYDLALRCIAKITPNKIRHIPRVLYHWRAHAESTALSHGTKNYATTAGYKALQDHFDGSGASVIETEAPGMYRIIYPLPSKQPLVTLIIPTRDQVQVLKKCIESIQHKTTYANFEVLVIDNQSQDVDALNYLATLNQDSRFKVIKYDKPFNYSAINNYAVSIAKGEIVGLVNNDIEVINDDWLSEMVRHVLRPDIGAVGAKLLYSDESLQHAGVILGIGGVANHSHKFYQRDVWGYFGRAKLQQEFSAVTAACFLVRKSVFNQVGGLDERNLTIAFNDVDFCIKVRESGLRNIYTPYAMLYHHESISRGQEDSPEKQARFASEVSFMQKKWGGILRNDPFYNPNLTNEHEDFSLASHKVESLHHGYPLVTN